MEQMSAYFENTLETALLTPEYDPALLNEALVVESGQALNFKVIKEHFHLINRDRILQPLKFLLDQPDYNGFEDFFCNHMLTPVDRFGRDEALEKLYKKMKSIAIISLDKNIDQ